MSEDGRALALYLLTCQHGTIAGVFRLPDGYVCEDIQWDAQRVSVTLCELLANGFATRCEHTKWVFVHKHLEWNPPENPNQKKAAAKMALQVPDSCCWKADFIGKHGAFLGLAEVNQVREMEPFPNPLQTLPQPVTVTVTVTEEIPSLSKPAVIDCPHEKILDAFSEKLPDLAQPIRSLWRDGKNAPALKARWSWLMTACHEKGKRKGERMATTEAEGVEWFGRFFAYVADSDFLMGRSSEWSCDLIWLVNKSNFEKVIQGTYENKSKEIAA